MKEQAKQVTTDLLEVSFVPVEKAGGSYYTIAALATVAMLLADINGFLFIPLWLSLLPLYLPFTPLAIMLSIFLAVLALITVLLVLKLCFKVISFGFTIIGRGIKSIRRKIFNRS